MREESYSLQACERNLRRQTRNIFTASYYIRGWHHIFKCCRHSPGLEDHWSHHAHEHDAKDRVVELHVALDGENQHAWHSLHCDDCNRAWAPVEQFNRSLIKRPCHLLNIVSAVIARPHQINWFECCRLTQQSDQEQNNNEVVSTALFVEV